MKLIRALHTGYGFVVFTILFLIFFPLFLIPITFPAQHKLTGVLNRWWAYCLFTLVGLPWKREVRGKLDPEKQYIFCPNHFSYIDIAAMGLNPINSIFVGKSAMEKIPLFGFMYRKLHITVDRSKLSSKYGSYTRSLSALDEGKSLMIFPEGGIISTNPPHMSRFKDGAFRLAIEKQISIVPVTLPYNWIILPDTMPMLLQWKKLHLVFHEPIDPSEYSSTDVETLKTRVYAILEQELKKFNT
jgi:1-acyl-sn-glycerol-3-phosphate acyltransferase